jgi:hypothetical protein
MADHWLPTLRVNPAYQLVAAAELGQRHREALGDVVEQPAFAAVLIASIESGLPDKVLDSASVDLLEAVVGAGQSKHELRDDDQLRLLYDYVLVGEFDDGWFGGPSAFDRLADPVVARPDTHDHPNDVLTGRSISYLDSIARLGLTDVERICTRLYCAGRIPLSSRWTSAYPDETAVLALFGTSLVDDGWRQAISVEQAGGWLLFHRDDSRTDSRTVDFPYKLYVSPHPAVLSEVIPVIVRSASSAGASRFKIGADAVGVLRPDKMVFYLTSADELSAVAAAVGHAIHGTTAHGVPFSAALSDDGLLSWGGDPPIEEGPIGSSRESWRLSVCRRLAEGLRVAVGVEFQHASPTDFALARLQLDGVNVSTFTYTRLTPPRPLIPAANDSERAA